MASPSSDNTSTGGAAIATSFIYPVGMSTVQPTWNQNNGNGYYISQGFNTSCDPSQNQGYYLYGLYYCGHTGTDLATSTASSVVHATANGIVVTAGYNGSYGVMVRIRHYLPDGSIVYSQYEHMAFGSLTVYSGEVVTQGQEIGLVGATGFVTGAHLHFEIKTVDEDGWGYTFGNSSLIAGYMDPIAFVAAHQLQPASYILSSGGQNKIFPLESEPVLQHFLQSYKHYVVVSVSDGLHVRSGPGLKAHILGTTLRGAKLGYIKTQGAWIDVALPQNVTGWVDKKYVTGYQDWDSADSAARPTWPPAGSTVGTVNVLGLNVRSGPGENHAIVTSVYQKDKVEVLSFSPHWASIKTRDGSQGWVVRQYIDVSGRSGQSTAYIVPTVPLLHVRSGPGLQYPVSGSVYGGTEMQLVRSTPHWAAVVLPGGTTGWVARPLTAPPSKAAGAVQRASGAVQLTDDGTALIVHATLITVAASILNIRSGPGQDHQVIAEVKQGTTLQVLALTTHWAHVALPASSIDGWVLRSYTQ